MLDTTGHARSSLLAYILSLLLCTAATYSHQQQPMFAQSSRVERVGDYPFVSTDVSVMQQLAEFQHRAPTNAELRRIQEYLDDGSWTVVGRALRILELHHYPRRRAAQLRLLKRAAAVIKTGPAAVHSPQEWAECLGVVHRIMDSYRISAEFLLAESSPDDAVALRSNKDSYGDRTLERLWADLALNAHDGHVRARALSILASESPRDLQQIVLTALNDPSERVCLVALEIAASRQLQATLPRVNELASSPRPELRQSAADVQLTLGSREAPREYGECVMRAAHMFADQLDQLGIDLDDPLGVVAGQRSESVSAEGLSRTAEAYLDRTGPATSDHDSLGLFLLAAAARAGQRKLTLRLWENEIADTDCEDELFEHGLRAVARTQLITGLAALRRDDRAAGIEAMSAVTRLARYAEPNSPLDAYVKQAGVLSAALCQDTIANSDEAVTPQLRRLPDAVTRVVAQVLDQLDLSRPDHGDEARRRLDQWCGLHSPALISVQSGHRQPLAN